MAARLSTLETHRGRLGHPTLDRANDDRFSCQPETSGYPGPQLSFTASIPPVTRVMKDSHHDPVCEVG